MQQYLRSIKKSADVRDVHVDGPLSSISTAYLQSQMDFVAGRVFPVVPVGKKSDLYYAWPKNTFFRNRAEKWTPGTALPQANLPAAAKPSFSCEFRAFEWPLGWDVRDNADEQVDLERAGSEFVTRVLLLEREIEWAAKYFSPSVWSTEYAGVVSSTPSAGQFTHWSDYENSDPEADVKTARLAMRENTGFRPNKMVVAESVFETLKLHPKIRELIKYTQTGIVTRELLARVFEVDELHVAGGVQITSPDGVATEDETYEFILGDHAWLGYVAPRPSRLLPSAGYIFSWNSFTRGFEVGIETVDDRRTKADYMQGITCYDAKQVSADLGVFFNGALP